MPIRLRFVTCNDPISALIRWAEDDWRSHVEAVVPEGYLGRTRRAACRSGDLRLYLAGIVPA